MALKAANNMNLNCDTFIKQEFLNAEEEVITSIPCMNLNTPVKNEPIFDESFPSTITLKSELSGETFLEGVNTIETGKSLQNQEMVTKDKEKFIIYELGTPPASQKLPALLQQTGLKKSPETYSSTSKSHISNIQRTEVLKTNNTSLVSNLKQSNLKNVPANNVTVQTTATSPILLNTQLRKRHKVILPLNPIDKRTRYNIQGTIPPLLYKNCSVTTDPTTNSNKCRLINTGSKKIINHLIKLRKPEEKSVSRESSAITRKADNQDSEKTVASTAREKNSSPVSSNNFNKTATKAQTQTPSSTTLSVNKISTGSSKQSTGSPIVSELRVKCLCSLTNDTSKDNSELKTFFKEMYDETRRFNKTQQRRIKMLLLKAICDAEESMEQGKCCGF